MKTHGSVDGMVEGVNTLHFISRSLIGGGSGSM